MHEVLWAGVELKVQYAAFHFHHMDRALEPPEQDAWYVNQLISRRILGTGWQLSFFAYFDAFLSTARSVPEIIQCCFGVDPATHRLKEMKDWFKNLPPLEQTHRKEFKNRFKSDYDTFRDLPLSEERHIIEHRTGVASVTGTIIGRFGVIYEGGPANPVPNSEKPHIADPQLAFLAKPVPLQPQWDDFTIDGQKLFPACQDYLARAQALVVAARRLSDLVHGTDTLTPPPS